MTEVPLMDQAADWAATTGLPRPTRTVLVMYAKHGNPDGSSVYPGEPKVAELVGVDERTVRRHVRVLRDLGVMHLVKSKGSPLRTDEYEIRFPDPPADEAIHDALVRAGLRKPDRTTVSGLDRGQTGQQRQPDRTLAAGRPDNGDRPTTDHPKTTPKTTPDQEVPSASTVAGRASGGPGRGDGHLSQLGREVRSLIAEVEHRLVADGIDYLGANDFGRRWPRPDMDTLRRAFIDFEPEATEVRSAVGRTVEIVQAQGRVPAIASLFYEQLAEVVGAKRPQKTTAATRTEAERTGVRAAARRSLEEAGR